MGNRHLITIHFGGPPCGLSESDLRILKKAGSIEGGGVRGIATRLLKKYAVELRELEGAAIGGNNE